ncbi:hypothetical protein D3C72_412930 [compost metagenome]
MKANDALACRRALREIREIAAVALLEGSQLTEQEALKTIAAIAEWVVEDRPPAACGDLIRRLDDLVRPADLEGMDDREAEDLFRDVETLLRSDDTASRSVK